MDMLKSKLTRPDIQYWPEGRWWLAEGFHTGKTLKKDIQQLYGAGFGATEFLAMGEAGADSTRYGWGSEEWVHDSQLIIAETTARKMGGDKTLTWTAPEDGNYELIVFWLHGTGQTASPSVSVHGKGLWPNRQDDTGTLRQSRALTA